MKITYLTEEEQRQFDDCECENYEQIFDLDCADNRVKARIILDNGKELIFTTSEWAQCYIKKEAI